MPVISGEARWANVLENNPNTLFEPTWKINLVIDDDNRKLLKQMGLEGFIKAEIVKEQPTGDDIITFYRKCETSNGKARRAPVVLMKDGSNCKKEIGNGSIVRVQFRLDEWEFKSKSGVRLDLQGVLVEKLVEFGGDGAELAEYINADADFTKDDAPLI